MAAKTTRKRTTRKRGGPKVDVYQIVTDAIVAALEAGVVPWQRPWNAAIDAPRSLSSRKPYRGVNVFLLLWTAAAKGYTSPWWGTYNQIAERGGNVIAKERGTAVVFWRMLEVKDDKAKDGKRKVPMLRYFTVFNADQCEGADFTVPQLDVEIEFEPHKEADRIVKRYLADGPTLSHGGNRAAYKPPTDRLMMPKPTSFKSSDAYYSTLFHELTHSTGHQSRLNRDGIVDPNVFGSEPYGKEELLAEMGAAFLCGESGIPPRIDQSAAYIGSWLTTIKGEPKLVVQAAGAAQKAADLILGRTYDNGEES